MLKEFCTQLSQKVSETLNPISAYLVSHSTIVPQDRFLILCVTSKISYIHKDKLKPENLPGTYHVSSC